MIKELFVLALAIIAGNLAAYSEELFRTIIAAVIVMIYYEVG